MRGALPLRGVPHEDDVWIDTDDVVDYARWLDARVRELDAAWKRTDMIQLPAVQKWARDWWIAWWFRWNTLRTQIESNYVDRVNAWDDVKTRHAELVGLREKAIASGLTDAPPLDPVPKEPVETMGDKLGDALGTVVDAGEAVQNVGVALLVAVVAGVVLYVAVKR